MAVLTVNFLFNTPDSVRTLDRLTAIYWKELSAFFAVLLQAGTLYGLSWITGFLFNSDFSSVIRHFIFIDTLLFTVMVSDKSEFIPFYRTYASTILFLTLEKYQNNQKNDDDRKSEDNSEDNSEDKNEYESEDENKYEDEHEDDKKGNDKSDDE
ncbi:hypothetical protein F4776DRAFT_665567 [Hypoxylon sp. NC0597]|nr:hypothetical protein F4776DRAFT_665567 [Hypoxylon sp. NC0597]